MVKRNKNKWRFVRRNKIGLMVFLVIAVYTSITMIKQHIKLQELVEEEQRIQEEIKTLHEEIKAVKGKIEESDNPELIEKAARDKLKMVKQNEIIYIIQDKKDNQ